MIAEMREAGISVRRVEVVPGEQTLYSICFVYPDGTGGNLTVDDSASQKVDPALIRTAEPDFARLVGTGMTLAAPEVPLEARAELLRLGRKYRFFNTARLHQRRTPDDTHWRASRQWHPCRG
jgi:ribokinase